MELIQEKNTSLNSFAAKVVDLSNNLPAEMKELESMNVFQSKVQHRNTVEGEKLLNC
jgi:hypothetical protein